MCTGQISPHFCTVEKLGPTEGPNILTVFILNENMVGHNEVPIIPMVLTFRCTQKYFLSNTYPKVFSWATNLVLRDVIK